MLWKSGVCCFMKQKKKKTVYYYVEKNPDYSETLVFSMFGHGTMIRPYQKYTHSFYSNIYTVPVLNTENPRRLKKKICMTVINTIIIFFVNDKKYRNL